MNQKEKARAYDAQQNQIKAQQLVDKFNELYPVGSKVMVRKFASRFSTYNEVTVQREAFTTPSSGPACFFSEISGYFSIDPYLVKYPESSES